MERSEVTAFVGMGANLGDAAQTLQDALTVLSGVPGVRTLKASSFYRTVPVDADGPDYVNAVAEIATTLGAPALLAVLQSIEQDFGRQRPYRNAPRTLDLDLLLYGDARMDSPALTLPHPRMGARAFVLIPLAELWPEGVSPAQRDAVRDQPVTRLPRH